MKRKVAMWQSPGRVVTVDDEATDGAVVGVNLRLPDGTMVTEAMLLQPDDPALSDWANLDGKPVTFPPSAHDASLVTTGTFADARIAASNVTQHQAALSIGIGQITGFRNGSVAWDPPSVAAGGSTTTTVAVAGAALGEFVWLSFSLSLAGLVLTGYVSAAGVVTAVLSNPTGGAVDLGSGTLRARVMPV